MPRKGSSLRPMSEHAKTVQRDARSMRMLGNDSPERRHFELPSTLVRLRMHGLVGYPLPLHPRWAGSREPTFAPQTEASRDQP